ncbi:MAG: LPS-assembly protein LptD [Deltaproteobacteria bacterium]|nr:MAG: LPS-assembly protein LptD [Deltaproteobacteria bacterium]
MKYYPQIFKVLYIATLHILLAILLFRGIAGGEEDQNAEEKIQIEGENLSYEEERGLYTVSEEAVIKWKGVTLEADKVIYDSKQDILEAEGNVILREGEDVLQSESLVYERKADRGIVGKGELFIEKENYRFSGDEIERLGKDEYYISHSRFTTCDCGDRRPSWEFAADDVRLTLGGYARARNIIFYVKGFPVFYLPYGIFPVKTERQSGFLLPEIAYSRRSGFELSQPYFWAIASNMDSTLFLNYLSERGVGSGVEYRYILSKKSRGHFYTGYLNEFLLEDEHRWIADYEHRQGLPLSLEGLVDLHRVSDLNYWRDFGRRLEDRSRPYLESRTSATKAGPGVGLVTEMKYYQDLWAFNDFGIEDMTGNGYFDEGEALRDEETIQELPKVDFIIHQQRVWKTPLYFDLDSSFNNFWRETKGFDDLGSDGLPSHLETDYDPDTNPDPSGDDYDPIDNPTGTERNYYYDIGEPIREGQRMDFHPRISLPIAPGDYFRLSPSVGFRETCYFSDVISDRAESREIYDLSLNLSSTVFRVFEFKGGSKVKHSLKPEVEYVYIPSVDQDDLPLFDPLDRIGKESRLSYSLKSFVIGKSLNASGGSIYRELVQFKIQQGYDFNRETNPFLPISGEVEIKPQGWLYLKSNLDYHVDKEKFLGFNILCHLSDRRGDFLRFEYRFLADDPGWDDEPGTLDDVTGIEWISGESGINLGRHISLSYRTLYSLLDEEIMESGYALRYISLCDCWSVDFTVIDRPGGDDDRYAVLLTLYGLGSVGTK